MAAAIRDRSAAPPVTAWPGSFARALTDSEASGALTRSCLTACGSAWPVNTVSAEATAAATRMVSAAAEITAQYAVIRRTASGPRGRITTTAFRT